MTDNGGRQKHKTQRLRDYIEKKMGTKSLCKYALSCISIWCSNVHRFSELLDLFLLPFLNLLDGFAR